MSSSVGELMILLSCAMRKRLEKTENCTTRSRTSSRDAEPDANHEVWLCTTMVFGLLERARGEREVWSLYESVLTRMTLGACVFWMGTCSARGVGSARMA